MVDLDWCSEQINVRPAETTACEEATYQTMCSLKEKPLLMISLTNCVFGYLSQ